MWQAVHGRRCQIFGYARSNTSTTLGPQGIHTRATVHHAARCLVEMLSVQADKRDKKQEILDPEHDSCGLPVQISNTSKSKLLRCKGKRSLCHDVTVQDTRPLTVIFDTRASTHRADAAGTIIVFTRPNRRCDTFFYISLCDHKVFLLSVFTRRNHDSNGTKHEVASTHALIRQC